jgi:hypothetical protein
VQEAGTKVTGSRSKVAKELDIKKTAAEDEPIRVANMTADKPLQFRLRLSDAETEVTTWSWAATEHVTNHLGRDFWHHLE